MLLQAHGQGCQRRERIYCLGRAFFCCWLAREFLLLRMSQPIGIRTNKIVAGFKNPRALFQESFLPTIAEDTRRTNLSTICFEVCLVRRNVRIQWKKERNLTLEVFVEAIWMTYKPKIKVYQMFCSILLPGKENSFIFIRFFIGKWTLNLLANLLAIASLLHNKRPHAYNWFDEKVLRPSNPRWRQQDMRHKKI